jgi:hypothetical protein
MPYGSAVTVSVLPEVVEAIGSKLSVEGGVLDILVSEVELDGAGVLAQDREEARKHMPMQPGGVVVGFLA